MGRAGRGRAAAFTVVAGLLLAAGYLAFVHYGPGAHLDQQAMQFASLRPQQSLITDLVPPVAVAAGIATVVLALVRRLGIVGLAAALLPALAPALADVLKAVLPPAQYALTYTMSNSYPSGHTAAATGSVLALVLVLPRRLRGPAVTLGSIWVGLVAAQLVAGGWHRPADVGGGALCALLFAGLLVLAARCRRVDRLQLLPTGTVRAGVLLGGALLAVAVLVVAVFGALNVAVIDRYPLHAFVVCAFSALAAAAGVWSALLVVPHAGEAPAVRRGDVLALDDAECQTVIGTRPS